MLGLLSGEKNWVRVGDPNQAINTTFTTADPRYLRDFLSADGVKAHGLTEAGRSARPIIDLANTLVRWAANEHPVEKLRTAFYPQDIEPTPLGDLQANPAATEALIHIQYQPGVNLSPKKEREMVIQSLERWLSEHPEDTVGVLVPENSGGFQNLPLISPQRRPNFETLTQTPATNCSARALFTMFVALSIA